MVDNKKLSDDEQFELRVQEVLDQLGECSEDEVNLVRRELKRRIPGPFVVKEIASCRVQDAIHELRMGLANAGLLEAMTDQECRVAINAVTGGSPVSEVIEVLRPTIEARIQAAKRLKPK